jgi:hypothetical protein
MTVESTIPSEATSIQPNKDRSTEGDLVALFDIDDKLIDNINDLRSFADESFFDEIEPPSYATKQVTFHKTSKRNIYKKVTFYIENDIIDLLDEIKDKTLINRGMLVRELVDMVKGVKKYLIDECKTPDDIETVLRRHYHLV